MLGIGNSYSAVDLPPSLVSSEMSAAIDRWKGLYYNNAPWLDRNSLSLGLPADIANRVSTMITLEAKISVTDMDGDEADDEVGDAELNPRAKLINEAMESIRDNLRLNVEYACALGGLMFKPYIDASVKKISVDYIKADSFYPTKVSADGKIIGAVFFERKTIKDKSYIRVEEHDYNPATRSCVIKNRAFESFNQANTFGAEIPLNAVADWAHLQPETPISDLDSPLFSYFKIPQGNIIDIESDLGVSVYARADLDGLLKEADKQFQRLMWEYEGGELAIDASSDAFKKGKDGELEIPANKERLYRINDLDLLSANAKEGLFSTFAPELRDSSYSKGLNDVLIKVENVCSLARGSLADVSEQARTATEMRLMRQQTYQLVTSTQGALENALNDTVAAIDALADLYGLTPKGEFHVSYVWDDSILTDSESERQRDLQEVREGLMAKWEFRKKWYGESKAKAQRMIAEQQAGAMTPDELMGFQKTSPKKNSEEEPPKKEDGKE